MDAGGLERYLDMVLAQQARTSMPQVVLILAVTPQVPSAAERKVMIDRLRLPPGEKQRLQVVLIDNVIARQINTALGWLMKDETYRFTDMAPRELDKAMTWLAEVGRFDKAEVVAAIKRMLIFAEATPEQLRMFGV